MPPSYRWCCLGLHEPQVLDINLQYFASVIRWPLPILTYLCYARISVGYLLPAAATMTMQNMTAAIFVFYFDDAVVWDVPCECLPLLFLLDYTIPPHFPCRFGNFGRCMAILRAVLSFDPV